MNTIKYRTLRILWQWWHTRLRDVYDLRSVRSKLHSICINIASWLLLHEYKTWAMCWYEYASKIEYRYSGTARPFYHLCCNGNEGGWRTDLCDWLETKWRDMEDNMYEQDNRYGEEA